MAASKKAAADLMGCLAKLDGCDRLTATLVGRSPVATRTLVQDPGLALAGFLVRQENRPIRSAGFNRWPAETAFTCPNGKTWLVSRTTVPGLTVCASIRYLFSIDC